MNLVAKVSPRVLGICGAGTVVIGMAVYRAFMENEVRDANRNVAAVASRMQAMEVERDGLRQSRDDLTGRTRELSNALARAEAGLATERDTHEPLRRQIEGMLAREIALQADLEKARQTIRDTQDSMGKAQADLAALAAEKQKVDGALAELQAAHAAEQQKAQARIDALDGEKQDLAGKLARSEKERGEAEAGLAETRQKLEAAEREGADLAQQLDAAKSHQVQIESDLGAARQQATQFQVDLEALRRELEALKAAPAPTQGGG